MNRIWIIVFGDLVSFIISFGLLILIRFNVTEYAFAIQSHTIPFLILYLFWVLVFYIFGLYDLVTIKPTIPYFNRWALALVSSFIVGLLLFYFVPIFGISPKINLLIQVLLFSLFSFLFRRFIYAIFSKTITRPTILIGESTYLKELKTTIEKNPQMGLRVIDIFTKVSEVKISSEKNKNVLVILDKNTDTSDDNILSLYKQGIEIIDTARAYEKYLFKIPIEYIDTAFIVENIDIKKNRLYTYLIFITDKIFALSILVLSSPIMLVAIVARIIEDGRPIFIKQKRVGLNGKIFNLYKMRSMIVLSPDGSAETTKAVWETGANDPRITPVGKIIRKLHIDEISQMINILKGDLSLIGPRPERPEFVYSLEEDIPHYKLRHIIKPGFTGWAQIKYHYARTKEESKEKFEYDLYYIKNRNIFLDFGIILRTIQIIFTH